MSYNVTYDHDGLWASIHFPNGTPFLVSVLYTRREAVGVVVLVVVSCISLFAVIGLLLAISLSAFNTRTAAAGEHLFIRTHVAAYFICLLMCDILQAIGSIMNAKWFLEMSVHYGNFCVAQGVLKQCADVGTALWSLIMAIHTFNILFLQVEMHRFVLYATLVGGWTAMAAIVVGGPAVLNTVQRGPFWGISGYWCWISEGYDVPRITCDYMIMFLSAGLCFLLYLLVFLRMRGNILVEGWRWTFRRTTVKRNGEMFHISALQDSYTKVVAGRMLLYPLAYTTLLLPIAICRFASWTGHEIPFEATIVADSIFLFSGLVNVILFSSTRRMLPPRSVFRWSIGTPTLLNTTATLPPSPGAAEKAGGDSPGYEIYDQKTPGEFGGSPMVDVPLAPPLPAPPGSQLERGQSTRTDGSADLPSPWELAHEDWRGAAPPEQRQPSYQVPVAPLNIRPRTGAASVTPAMPTAQFMGQDRGGFEAEDDYVAGAHPYAAAGRTHSRQHSRDSSYGAGEWAPSQHPSPTQSQFRQALDAVGVDRSDSMDRHFSALYRNSTAESRRPGLDEIDRGEWDRPGRF